MANKEKLIDLHVHSTASDGTFTPTELVKLAKDSGLSAFALTDHDTTAGIAEALEAGREYGVEVIPGIELSTTWWNRDVHIVGLGIDSDNVYFQEELQHFLESRDMRNFQMMDLLNKEGIDISYEKMMEEFPDSVWTRAHFARYLLDHHFVGSMNEAFDRYLGDHAKCYVPREKVTPFQGIQLIHEGGGKAIFAHPILCRFSDEHLESLVAEFKRVGLDGLEAMYSSYRWADENKMTQLAKRHHLKISGGSDFHGSNKPNLKLGTGYGNLSIPYSILENLLK